MATERREPVELPCVGCRKTAAVVIPPAMPGDLVAMLPAMFTLLSGGQDTPDLPNVADNSGRTLYGFTPDALAVKLTLRCPRCFIEAGGYDG